MSFDFTPTEKLRSFDKSAQGALNYQSGLAAEDSVERHYEALGAQILVRRWRGKAGEVDLVLRLGDEILFVEVKKAATCAAAAERLSFAQLARIMSAAEEYIGELPDGLLTPVRFDAALVDSSGAVEVIENISLS